ncbi:RNA-directed DNA polymerase from mobile element jockey-like [Brachionus plicatilis]|uniref:RNA-directed DNA polymerase from mobile element jockey-like n=1 Tax=Brachionus plicatilis TaxID=10195 RepID=A0A3M7PUT7_BRAPC|nr:RNA-directed DNA polymerase from mobile element jockey-like [Brachionus plicatilis]
MGKNPLSSRPFWEKINKFRSKKSSKLIPTLLANNQELSTDSEKGKFFGEFLSLTFSSNSDLINNKTDSEITDFNSNFFKSHKSFIINEPISLKEINVAIRKLKEEGAPGPDKIQNIMLKNLPRTCLLDIKELFNRSILQARIPKEWKTAFITMIPKKSSPLNDPTNYRPISMTSCIEIYGNKLESQKNFDPKLTFNPMVEDIKKRCNSRLNLIKILLNKKWGLNTYTLSNLYKSLIGSILDYSFPCLNLFSESNIKRIQAIQNSAVRFILKLKYDTPSDILHNEAFDKLKLLKVSNRLFELAEKYVGV